MDRFVVDGLTGHRFGGSAVAQPLRRRALVSAAALAVVPYLMGAAPAQDAGAPSGSPAAADSVLEARTAAVAATLRCPVCQGESIQDSPALLAQEMRGVVRDQLRAGKSPEQIKAYFVARYGEWILLEPTMKGLNVGLYLFPVLLIAGGLALVAILVRRWSSTDAAVESS